MNLQIRKAVRKKAKLRLGMAGPSGSGKTYSALLLAFGLGGKVGMIDTEHGSGDLYADLGDYDIINIDAPYTVKKYRDAIKAFEDAGYDVIIIDSLSHAWAGEGGLLDKQGKIADSGKPGMNSYAAWRTVTPEHNGLVEAMLTSPCHIIATMRSKQEYVQDKNDNGKTVIKKVGMSPVQRDGMEYEFTVMFDIDTQHVASTSKDRTRLFDGQYFTITREQGTQLLEWLEEGEETLQTISVSQRDELLKLLTEAGLSVRKFCQKYEIDQISSLPASLFDEAKASICEYREKKLERLKQQAAERRNAETEEECEKGEDGL
ncbi:ATP-binding protein [Oxalobacter paraformigenes]|uniref:AAA+ ATPase domain-containing protein n=1 Tax=Oxalobacter paraformigenes TaxID=556268 RepID=C3X2N6_9BURK|nr:ATP-binding protein [Oxalobacter paraformigenes]EEO27472.1 hypothetical protein OFAG_00625 [Oxalobacter paraformigenes]